jgi:hypothetical protein
MDQPPAADRFVGIDVSKGRVDVYVRPDAAAFACTTDPDGLGDVVARTLLVELPELGTVDRHQIAALSGRYRGR